MRLYTRYVDAKADRLVTIPDEITRQLQEDIVGKQTSDPKVFKKAEADVLNLMTDNIYPAFIKAKAAARGSAPAPAAEKPAGGGSAPSGRPSDGSSRCTCSISSAIASAHSVE